MAIEHANWIAYVAAVHTALDELGEALKSRYEHDLDDHKSVWTPAGTNVPEVGAIYGDVEPGPGYTDPWEAEKPHITGWVEDILAAVRAEIPVYDNQDLNELHSASEQLKRVAEALGHSPGTQGAQGRIPDLLDEVNNAGGQWQGISADQFGEHFGKSVGPTMRNQRDFGASLAHLYAARAAIISAIRGHVLSLIRNATESLGGTVASGNETVRWTFASVISVAVGFSSAPLGVILSVAAIVGSVVDPLDPHQKSEHEIGGVVTGLLDGLRNGQSRADENETAYSSLVVELQDAITAEDRRNLELYDFIGNGGVGRAESGAYEVVRGAVERLAEGCFAASEEYEQLIRIAVGTDDADSHLKGINNVEQVGDVKLKDTRDTFVGFLQTTCARYREAGDRLLDAARAYDNAETTNTEILEAIEKETDFNGDRPGAGGTVEQHVGATPPIPKHWPA